MQHHSKGANPASVLSGSADALRPWVRAIRAWAEIARWRGTPAPVLVHTMPKSGSTTVSWALARAGILAPKTHWLGAGHDRLLEQHRRCAFMLPYHLHVERVLRDRLGALPRLRVIAMVRDPVALELSTMFQAPWLFEFEANDPRSAEMAVRRRIENGTFGENWLLWFSEEIDQVFRGDLLSLPFDHEAGALRIKLDAADLMILKTEKLDELVGPLSDFVGRPLVFSRANVRVGQRGGTLYASLRDRLRLPRSTLEALYTSPWMRHFYSEAEIDRFLARWSA